MEKLTDTPKVPQVRRGAVSDSPQALRGVCMLYHSVILPLKYTDSSCKGREAHIQSHFPHTWVHRLQT